MHPRKLNLHLSLFSQFQLPIELRCIIIENYFPFLPNDQQPLTVEKLKRLFTEIFADSDLQYNNIIPVNCMISSCLYIENWWGGDEGLNILFRIRCIHKLVVYDLDSYSYYAFIKNAEDEESCKAVLDQTLCWYRNKLLASIH